MATDTAAWLLLGFTFDMRLQVSWDCSTVYRSAASLFTRPGIRSYT